MCRALDLDFYIGPRREPPSAELVDPGRHPDFALVPAFAVEASAGNGATAVDALPDGALAFRTDWLSRQGVNVANAALLRARGDSMQPVIWDGDILMIDQARTTPRDARLRSVNYHKGKHTYRRPVFVSELDGELLVKIIRQVADDRVQLVSENLDYDPIELRGDEMNRLRIIGQVVWWGHTVG